MFLITGLFMRKAAGLMLAVSAIGAAIQIGLLQEPVSYLFFVNRVDGLGTGFFMLAFLLLLILGPGNLSFDAGRRKAAAE